MSDVLTIRLYNFAEVFKLVCFLVFED